MKFFTMKQTMKLFLLLVIPFQLLTPSANAQDQKEIDFKKACDGVLQSISQKKLSLLNSYINKSYGLYVKYRSGVYDRYQNLKKINGNEQYGTLEGSIFDWTRIAAADLKKFNLQYGKLPSYVCEPGAWSKKGFVADSVKKYKPISEVVAFQLKYEETKLSRNVMVAIKFVEQNSRKIIFAGSKGDGLIFYMLYLNGKWYLSVIDEATTDCSA